MTQEELARTLVASLGDQLANLIASVRAEERAANHEFQKTLVEYAVKAERERCAAVAVSLAVAHRDRCHTECRCADGWHIAAAIRAGS